MFKIENSKVTNCPYSPKASVRTLLTILQKLSAKPLGQITKKINFPNKDWLINAIWALDPNNKIFKEESQNFVETLEREIPFGYSLFFIIFHYLLFYFKIRFLDNIKARSGKGRGFFKLTK